MLAVGVGGLLIMDEEDVLRFVPEYVGNIVAEDPYDHWGFKRGWKEFDG